MYDSSSTNLTANLFWDGWDTKDGFPSNRCPNLCRYEFVNNNPGLVIVILGEVMTLDRIELEV
jgi:hypothetical protein